MKKVFSWLFKKQKQKQKQVKAKTPLLHVSDSNSKKGWGIRRKIYSLPEQEMVSLLEEILLTSDVSVKTTMDILSHLQVKSRNSSPQHFLDLLKEELQSILMDQPFTLDPENLNILFVFGVNGVGKTTSIAKLAYYFTQQEKDVLLAAADTYRAAAVDQLKLWAHQIDCPIVLHEGKSKPSAVVYDAVESAVKRNRQVLLIDTAGRFHNREDLLSELNKLQRIIQEKAPHANVKNLLVIDSTTGQNALEQARNFHESVHIDGVILSKWDSSGKGGIVITLSHELQIPVYFMGMGEKIEQIIPFQKEMFISQLIEE